MNRFRFIKVRDVKSPSRGNAGDAGLDFYVPENLSVEDLKMCNKGTNSLHLHTFHNMYVNEVGYITKILLAPGESILIPSGIKSLIEPRESMLMVANKSGISTKQGLLFTAEIVDSPYIGEIHLGVYNSTKDFQIIQPGSKLLQLIHVPVYLTEPYEINKEEFENESKAWGTRGEGGFGSTGK